jgi:hypothetical protein
MTETTGILAVLFSLAVAVLYSIVISFNKHTRARLDTHFDDIARCGRQSGELSERLQASRQDVAGQRDRMSRLEQAVDQLQLAFRDIRDRNSRQSAARVQLADDIHRLRETLDWPTGPVGAVGLSDRPTGPVGDAGLSGPTGPVGAVGLSGPTSPAGEIRPAGPTGPPSFQQRVDAVMNGSQFTYNNEEQLAEHRRGVEARIRDIDNRVAALLDTGGLPVSEEFVRRSNIMGALARSYTHPMNHSKVLDPDLIVAMTNEILDSDLLVRPSQRYELGASAPDSIVGRLGQAIDRVMRGEVPAPHRFMVTVNRSPDGALHLAGVELPVSDVELMSVGERNLEL